MATLLDYKCPCCDAPIKFSAGQQKMTCEYCGNEYDIDMLSSLDDALKEQSEDQMAWSDRPGNEWMKEELDGKSVYLCNSCGGQVIADTVTGATSCPYCGSPVVIVGQFAGDLKPDVIIPFKLDKQHAEAALKDHLKGKILLPKSFKTDSYISEIKALYVPFWLFDAKCHGDASFEGTKITRWHDSQYDYKKTEYYLIKRKASVLFKAVPVDGSTKLNNDLMESIEPFDVTEAVDFKSAYLSGYLADKYDVSSEDCIDRANERIKSSTISLLKSTISGYDSLILKNSSAQFTDSKIRYALYPVWILSSKWRDEMYTFAMNGQTGKMVGNLPMDKLKFWIWLLSSTVGGFILSLLLGFWLFG